MTPDEILNDFRRRYEHTFLHVQEPPPSSEENLFYVDSIESDPEKMGILNLSSDDVGKIRINFGSAHTLKFNPVPVGVFQHEADAYFCRRKPAKQYSRGICSGNTDLYPITNGIFQLERVFNYALINDAFIRSRSTLQGALKMLATNKYRSVALRDNYALSLSFSDAPDYVLFFWNSPIAKMTKEGKVSRVLEACMEPLINQFLREEENANS